MEDITERFDPISVDARGAEAMQMVRDMFKTLAVVLQAESRLGRAQSIAFTELESASRAAMRAVAEAHSLVKA